MRTSHRSRRRLLLAMLATISLAPLGSIPASAVTTECDSGPDDVKAALNIP